MDTSYYIIHLTEDAELHIEELTPGTLEARLNSEYYGSDPTIFSRIPNVEYDSGLLIIKGQIVVPKAKKKVVQWEVE